MSGVGRGVPDTPRVGADIIRLRLMAQLPKNNCRGAFRAPVKSAEEPPKTIVGAHTVRPPNSQKNRRKQYVGTPFGRPLPSTALSWNAEGGVPYRTCHVIKCLKYQKKACKSGCEVLLY